METPNGMPADASKDALVNVVPFRTPGEAKPPSLTPVENNAFNELARQLSARLENEQAVTAAIGPTDGDPASRRPGCALSRQVNRRPTSGRRASPQWLNEPAPPPRGEASRDKALLDLMPLGVLIYRLDRLLYANRAFLDHMGYASLHALDQAGGLDALFVEPGVSSVSPHVRYRHAGDDFGKPPPPTTETPAADAHLHTISWDGESALALIFSGAAHMKPRPCAATADAGRHREAVPAPSRRQSGMPMPKSSAPSSTPRPKAS